MTRLAFSSFNDIAVLSTRKRALTIPKTFSTLVCALLNLRLKFRSGESSACVVCGVRLVSVSWCCFAAEQKGN